MKIRIVSFLVIGLILLSALSACAPQATPAPSVSIETVWGKPSPSMAGAGAFFMVIKNTGTADDKLVSVKSSACGMTELHEMVKAADGTMKMQLVTDGVAVPATGQLELKSGSYHIMCMKMAADQIVPGAKPVLELTFEKSGTKSVTVDMRSQ
jgi:periplasmic copper chaperone A